MWIFRVKVPFEGSFDPALCALIACIIPVSITANGTAVRARIAPTTP
jgi:hypothetical protein